MERSKRPICGVDADLEEEEKMERFFDLIKTFREARSRLRIESDGGERSSKKTKKEMFGGGGSGRSSTRWVPSFEWGDFTEKVEFDRSRLPSALLPPRDSRKDGDRDPQRNVEEVEDDRLDLTLTL